MVERQRLENAILKSIFRSFSTSIVGLRARQDILIQFRSRAPASTPPRFSERRQGASVAERRSSEHVVIDPYSRVARTRSAGQEDGRHDGGRDEVQR